MGFEDRLNSRRSNSNKFESRFGKKKSDPMQKVASEIENKKQLLLRNNIPIPDKTADDRNFLERTLNTPQNTGFLGDVLDVLSRGQYASANIAKALVDNKQDSFADVMRSGARGLAGEDRTSYSDVLGEAGMEPGWARSVLGFAGDVLLDPTTYLTLGYGAAAKAGGKAGAKGLGKLITKATGKEVLDRGGVKFAGLSLVPQTVVDKGLEKSGAKALGSLIRNSKPAQVAGKALIPNFRETDTVKDVWDSYVDLKKGYQNTLEYAQNKAVEDAIDFGKGLTREERTQVTHLMQNPDFIGRNKPKTSPYIEAPQGINEKQWYHGTGAVGLKGENLSPNNTKIEGLFGQGIYLTDNYDIAKGYANARAKRTNAPTVYGAKVNINKVLDLEKPMPQDAFDSLHSIAAQISKNYDEPGLVEGIKELFAKGATGGEVWRKLSNDLSNLSADLMIPKSELYEYFDDLTADLKGKGYDAYTHVGGKNTGKDPHQVLIMLDPNNHIASTGRAGQVSEFLPMAEQAATKGADVLKNVSPKVLKAAEQAEKMFADSAQIEQTLGLLKNLREGYVPGIYRQKGRSLMEGIRYNPSIKATIGKHGKAKKFDTLQEAIDAGLDPETDIAKLLGVRQVASKRATTTQKFINDVVEKYGQKVTVKDIDDLPDNMGIYLPKGSLKFFSQDVIKGNVGKFTETGKTKTTVKEMGKELSGIEKQMDQIVKSMAASLREADKGVRGEGVHTKIRSMGGISPSKTGAFAGEFKESVPSILKNKNGLPLDEIASQLGMTARELLDELGKPAKRTTDYLAEARKMAERNPEYQALQKTLDTMSQEKTDAAARLAELLQSSSDDELIEIPLSMIRKGVGVSKDVPVVSLPRQIAEDLNHFKKSVWDEGAKGLMKYGYDLPLNLWKAYATATNPGFHIRNALSNQFQVGLNNGAAVLNPMNQLRASAVALADAPLGIGKWLRGKKIKVGDQAMNVKDAKELMKKEGVLNQGWFAKEIPDHIESELTGGLKGKLNPNLINPFSQGNLLIKGGRGVGNVVENQGRALSFLGDLQKGLGNKQAAENVNKFLFDYGDKTPFEREVMTRLIPFYTWMRKNLPLQAEQVLKQPGKYAGVPKAINAIEQNSEPVDETFLPEYMQNWVRTPFTQGDNPVYLNPNLPFGDIEKMDPTEMKKTAMSSLTPALKVPMELLPEKGYSYFFEEPIERYAGELKKAPGYMPGLPEALQKLLGAKMVTNEDTGEEELKLPAKTRYLLKQLPFAENVSRAIEYEDDKLINHLLAFLAGAKVAPYDIEKGKKNALYDERQTLRDLVDKLTAEGVILNEKKKTGLH